VERIDEDGGRLRIVFTGRAPLARDALFIQPQLALASQQRRQALGALLGGQALGALALELGQPVLARGGPAREGRLLRLLSRPSRRLAPAHVFALGHCASRMIRYYSVRSIGASASGAPRAGR
jgi:hypothetical protein